MIEWRHPVLRGWADELLEQSGRASSIIEGLSPEQLVARPKPGGWGIAHCLEHLATTVELYRPGLEAAIHRGEERPPMDPPEYRPGRFARWFIRMAGPESSRPLKAPKKFQPQENASPDAGARFAVAQKNAIALLERADGIDINRWKLASPVTRLLRFRVGEALELLVRHNERHLAQAERAKGRC